MLDYLWSVLGQVQHLGIHGIQWWDNEQTMTLRGFGMTQSLFFWDDILTFT
jgi:hypothetical protein